MLLIWLVVAAFLYWPFRNWQATYKAPLISALLWPIMVFFFIGFIIWAKISDRKDNERNNSLTANKSISLQEAGAILSKAMLPYTQTSEEQYALAKQLLTHAKIDLLHEYYYPKGMLASDLTKEIDFSIYSEKFYNFYIQQEKLAEDYAKLLQSEDYDPDDYYHEFEADNKYLDKLDLFEVKNVFDSLVANVQGAKEKFKVKLLIVDNMIR